MLFLKLKKTPNCFNSKNKKERNGSHYILVHPVNQQGSKWEVVLTG